MNVEEFPPIALFEGIGQDRLQNLLDDLHARIKRYKKGEWIITEGDAAAEFGLLLSGQGRVFKLDAMGRAVMITTLHEGSEIGVLLAACPGRRSPVSVQTAEDSRVLHIAFDRLVAPCEDDGVRERLLRNYTRMVAEKGLMLHERLDCLLKPTVREKVLAYLQRMSCEKGSRDFTVPLDRNAMSEYLNVERSALSRELSRMKRDGLIAYRKNAFKLLS